MLSNSRGRSIRVLDSTDKTTVCSLASSADGLASRDFYARKRCADRVRAIEERATRLLWDEQSGYGTTKGVKRALLRKSTVVSAGIAHQIAPCRSC
jgi:hypothetical protein